MDGDFNQVEVKPMEQLVVPVVQPQPVKPVKSSKTPVIIMAIVIVCLLGIIGVGTYFYLNQAKCAYTAVETDNTVGTSTDPVDVNAGYLVLEDWGVKFQLPTDLGSNVITYHKATDLTDGYYFSTQRVEAQGGACVPTGQGYTSMGAITRQNSLATGVSYGPVLVDKIGAYYYYYSHPQATCGDNVANAEVEDAGMLQVMLWNIEKE